MFRTPVSVPGLTTWNAGNYRVRIAITTGNAQVTLHGVYVCRVNSLGVSIATVGKTDGLSIATLPISVIVVDVAGAVQTASAGDRLAIDVSFTRTATTGQSVGITPSQLIDVPW